MIDGEGAGEASDDSEGAAAVARQMHRAEGRGASLMGFNKALGIRGY